MSFASRIQAAKKYIQHHERHIGTAALLIGAAFDWITITKPDSLFGLISITSYLVMALGGILLLNARTAREKESVWLLILIQFCFGNLSSGLLVLYSQSATLVGSWLFLLALLGFLIGNEFARERYLRLRSHIIGFYVLLSAYCAFMLPILLSAVGTRIFLLSSAVSFVLIFSYGSLVYAAAPSRVRADWKGTFIGLILVTLLFNGFYFLGVIPPVPLSLTEVSMFHSVVKDGNAYIVSGEVPPKWYDLRSQLFPSVHITAAGGAYCFSSVYAPVGLTAPIYHRWEQYDAASKTWVTRLKVAFPINGGRAEGYRGYTFKAGLTEGKWRCSIETTEGALIGRETFTVSFVASPPTLVVGSR